MPVTSATVKPGRFNYSEATGRSQAHKSEYERMRASAEALSAYSDTLTSGTADHNQMRAQAEYANALAAHHQTLHDRAQSEIRQNSSFFQRNKSGLQKAMIGLAVTSEIVTIPFFCFSIAQMIQHKTGHRNGAVPREQLQSRTRPDYPGAERSPMLDYALPIREGYEQNQPA